MLRAQESDHNALAQYGRQNNIVLLNGIQELVSGDVLEESVMFLLKVKILRLVIGLANLIKDKSQKTIVWFVNRKNCKKVLLNKKKLNSIDCSKHNFTQRKIFANENLTPMNESIAYNCRKLKRSGLIHGCFSRDGIVRIKCRKKDRPVKIFHMDKLHGLFCDSYFGDAEDKMRVTFLCSQVVNNDSVQSSY